MFIINLAEINKLNISSYLNNLNSLYTFLPFKLKKYKKSFSIILLSLNTLSFIEKKYSSIF